MHINADISFIMVNDSANWKCPKLLRTVSRLKLKKIYKYIQIFSLNAGSQTDWRNGCITYPFWLCKERQERNTLNTFWKHRIQPSNFEMLHFVSHRKHKFFITQTSRLVPFGVTIPLLWENHTEYINSFCGLNAEFI